MKNYVDKDKLQEYSTKLTAKYKTIFATKNEVGSPLVASTVAEMTDTNKVYVYTGSETGYTSGNWYYYDGSAWVSGGIYNAVAFETDTTLTQAGEAADAKAVGDAIGLVSTDVSSIENLLDSVISTNILFEEYQKTLSGARYVYYDIFTLENPDVKSKYTFSIESVTSATSTTNLYIRFYDSNDEFLSQIGSASSNTLTVTPPGAAAKIVFRLYASADIALTTDAVFTGIKVIKGETLQYGISDDAYYNRLDNDERTIELLTLKQAHADNVSMSLEKQGIYTDVAFAIGTISSTDHETDTNVSTRARTAFIPVKKDCIIKTNSSNLSFYTWTIWKYDTNREYINSDGMRAITDEYKINHDGYIRITVKKTSDESFTNEDIILLDNNIIVLSLTALNILKYGEQLANIVTGVDAIPDYWLDTLNADIAKIQSLDIQTGANGDSFVFITDTHVESNAMVSPLLISNILKQTAVDKVVHGGDIFQSDYTKTGAIAKMFSWFSKMYNTKKYYQIRGNHDINDSIDGVSSDEYLTDAEYYVVCVKRSSDYIHDPNFLPYYYYDNENQKIRYFVLDTGSRTTQDVSTYMNAQLSWMETHIDELDSSWGIVVFLHIMFIPKLYTDTSNLSLSDRGNLLKTKLDSLYGRANKPEIICVICGHVHRDYSLVSSVGYPIIATGCDTGSHIATDYDPVNTDRTQGTTNEQLFDICHIDKTNRKIYMTRIGAGTDRVFDY